MPNYYYTSTGERYSQAQIDKKLSETYRKAYAGEPHPYCHGCGKRATETSHIISQRRCKILRKTELIWNVENMFPACRDCHMLFEGFKNEKVFQLFNYKQCLNFIKLHDSKDYERRISTRNMETD